MWLTSNTKVRDWFLFENHTIIRIYGSQLNPFLLSVFLTLRIFSLEYIRKRLDFDSINFVSKKHQVTFNLKKEVGPFMEITRAARGIVEKMLQDMNHELEEE